MKIDDKKNELEAIIKWAGGKEKELKFIIPNAPENIDNYYEPFVGGGSVFVSIEANKYYINDKSQELISLYKSIANKNVEFFEWLSLIALSWKTMKNFINIKSDIVTEYKKYRSKKITEEKFCNYIELLVSNYKEKFKNVLDKKFLWKRDILLEEIRQNLLSKTMRMAKIELEKGLLSDKDLYDNIETAFMSALYMYYRHLYNNSEDSIDKQLATALFVFIRNYAYSGMFRYNANGLFNVPYGGIGYNNKTLEKKISYYRSEELSKLFSKTAIYCLDFEEFLEKNNPRKNDFIFLDPPYDTEFSTYAKNEFNKRDQERLADYLCNKCKSRWLMIIKNTPFIYSLYKNKNLNIIKFDKKYTVSFMNRNNKQAEHLIIKNY